MMNIIRFNQIIPLLFFFHLSQGQSFKTRAALEKVTKSGFYALPVTPELSSYVKTDFSDLRIVDEHGLAVPYTIKSSLPGWVPARFETLSILSNEMKDSGRNELVLVNSKKQPIADFSLRIRNAAISRSARLSGSDDLRHWFSISENLNFEKRFVTDADTYLENISFPLSSYRYLKLTIENGHSDPLNILSAGTYTVSGDQPVNVLSANPENRFTQTDSSNQVSYIRMVNQSPFHISSIAFSVRGPRFFRRAVALMVKNQLAASFTISSDSLFRIQVPVFKTTDWEIRIANGDNPPLDVKSVKTGQDPKKIIAFLDSGMTYQLMMTNEGAVMPHYDLQDFKDSLSASLPVVTALPAERITATIEPTGFFSKNKLWLALFGVLIVLIYFTVKLTRQLPDKK